MTPLRAGRAFPASPPLPACRGASARAAFLHSGATTAYLRRPEFSCSDVHALACTPVQARTKSLVIHVSFVPHPSGGPFPAPARTCCGASSAFTRILLTGHYSETPPFDVFYNTQTLAPQFCSTLTRHPHGSDFPEERPTSRTPPRIVAGKLQVMFLYKVADCRALRSYVKK